MDFPEIIHALKKSRCRELVILSIYYISKFIVANALQYATLYSVIENNYNKLKLMQLLMTIPLCSFEIGMHEIY